MCGVPVHAAEGYLLTLIRKGFRVAIAEQLEDPAEAKKRGYKAVVKRDVVRLVTPGTLTEESLLDARRHNFLAAFCRGAGRGGAGLGRYLDRRVPGDALSGGAAGAGTGAACPARGAGRRSARGGAGARWWTRPGRR